MKTNFFLILFILAILITGTSYSLAEKNLNKEFYRDKTIQKNKLDNVEKELLLDQKVEVLIKKDKNINSLKKNLRQKNISFEELGSHLVAKIDSENYVNLKKIESLEIISTKKYSPLLINSTTILNATLSWNLQINNSNLTGLGQTICIIDTGVNFSHPDLGGCFGDNDLSSNCKIIGGWNTVLENNNITDLAGHGTHVAGIAAANGAVKGVAPESKVVMIKAYNDSGGYFNSADVIEGISWCINNASKFNISVISMSLGVDCDDYPQYCYTGYCNNEQETPYINSAVLNNISVVIASGNDGYSNIISSPACVQNATPIGSTPKTDASISTFSNMWNNSSLMIFTSPGESINSTYVGQNYQTQQGTSMSTPHAAGTIAIINQVLRNQNISRTPDQLETLLNFTGKQIFDSFSNRTFPRLDIYTSILNLDYISPLVNLSTPVNASVNTTQNQTFTCNFSDWQLKNVTFYLWNSSDLYYNETKTVSGIINSSTFIVSNITIGSYSWNCYVKDTLGNVGLADQNSSLIIGEVLTTLNSPQNNFYTNQNETNFNCFAVSDSRYSLTNITLNVWKNNSVIFNSTSPISGLANFSNFSYNLTNETNYTWNCRSQNNNSYSDFGDENFKIVFDQSYPLISSASSEVTTTTTTLTWDTNEATNYSLNLSGRKNNSTYSANHFIFIESLSASTTYEYNLSYCDKAGNCNLTSGTITTSSTPNSSGSSSSSGGGGGGSVTTKIISEEKISLGTKQEISQGEKIIFKISEKKDNHTLTLNKVTNNSANITIRSQPVNFIITVGEEKKLNISSSNYYDLFIKLESVNKNKINLTIKEINEPILENHFVENKKYIPLGNNSIDQNLVKEVNTEFELTFFFVVLVILLFFIYKKGKK